jgi:BirA family biotin operon repressor/biotin-[acetyl-CoA-carboxylase] ligase
MKTLFIGQKTIHLNTVDSTNSYAIDLLKQIKPVEGTLIYTFDQIKGRGQRGNEWLSETNKNVALSLILYPTFLAVSAQFLLTKIASLAVADLMSVLLVKSAKSLDVKIKWPNDVYVNNQKIAGILIENSLKDSLLQTSIIGIGINVNQEQFSTQVKNPISLKLLLNAETDLNSCLEKLCEHMEARYLQLKANKFEKINADYLSKLYLLNEWHNYRLNGNAMEGKITGVSEIGKLKVETKLGELKEFDLKEIEF